MASPAPSASGHTLRAAYNAATSGSLPKHLAFLLHTVYASHAYPNYLTEKFASDAERPAQLRTYVSLLEDELSKARAAQTTLDAKRTHLRRWEAAASASTRGAFAAAAADCAGCDVAQDLLEGSSLADCAGVAAVTPPHTPVGQRAYTFPVLSRQACAGVLGVAEAYRRWEEEGGASGRQRRVVTEVDALGGDARRFVDALFECVVRPFAAEAWGWRGGGGGGGASALDARYAFLARYEGAGGGEEGVAVEAAVSAARNALAPHTDDCEVTLTVLLGGTWTDGGRLCFRHHRSSGREGVEETTFAHAGVGHALVHSGRHLHEVTPLTSAGTRTVLVLWARSSEHRREHCPCCTMFGRERCLMGAGWPQQVEHR